MVRPSMDATLLAIAHVMSMRGTCPRSAVGAVIAREGRILSSGYNGSPAGTPHCDHPAKCEGCDPQDPRRSHTDRHLGWHLPDCTEVTGCLTAIHAEANAIAYAARHGTSLEGATLYTTVTPCRACAQLIIQAGIIHVHAAREYRDRSGTNLLRTAMIDVTLEPDDLNEVMSD